MTLRELFKEYINKYETTSDASIGVMRTLLDKGIMDDSIEAANISASFAELTLKMKSYEVKESNTYIIIQKLKELLSPDDEEYIDVSGCCPDEGDDALALEYTPWEDWLNMHISPKSLQELDCDTIVAVCMFEMTFNGYTEDEVLESYNQLLSQYRDIQKKVDDKAGENSGSLEKLPMEELLKELGIDNNEVIPMVSEDILEKRMEEAHEDWLSHIAVINAALEESTESTEE